MSKKFWTNKDMNFALGDLEIVAKIEENAIEAFVDKDTEQYYMWIKAYFHKLSSMIDFDRQATLAEFKRIKDMIWAPATSYVEGEYDQLTDQQNVRLAIAMEALEEIYFKLSEYKVKADLSVAYKNLESIQAAKANQEKKANYPILDL